jgi:hypothetical protein
MISLNIKHVEKLERDKREIYLGTATLAAIKQWGIQSWQELVHSEYIIVVSLKLERVSKTEIHLTEPLLTTRIPLGQDYEEFPVLFLDKYSYLPFFLEDNLLKQTQFLRLIETGKNISKHSTKLLTQNSLREILLRTFPDDLCEYGKWDKLSGDLIRFLNVILNTYSYLDYLSISERIEFRKQFVSDLSFAWEMYFRYFVDTWSEKDDLSIPNLNKVFKNETWSGNFFCRENPLWEEVVGSKQRFKLNSEQREFIYLKWKQCLKEPE